MKNQIDRISFWLQDDTGDFVHNQCEKIHFSLQIKAL